MRQVVRIHHTPARVFGGCGVQITGRWILTARHCVKAWKPAMLQIRRGEDHRAVRKIVPHPDPTVDLALVELEGDDFPVLEPIHLLEGTAEIGARLWIGGFGLSGPAGSLLVPGRFAAGFNRLQAIVGRRGRIVFDAPGEASDAMEALPALLDSGSPVFIKDKGKWLLFGITVTASGRFGPGYGDRSHHELVESASAWISVTVADPEESR